MNKSNNGWMVGIGTLMTGIAAVLALYLRKGDDGQAPPPGPGPEESAPVPRTSETFRLSPSLGSSPRRSGTLVADGICPGGYGASGTILSEPTYIGIAGPMDFRTPDGRGTSQQRAFLTFSLAGLPRGAVANRARLSVPVTGLSDNGVYQREVVVESVDIGHELEASDHAAGGVLQARATVGGLASSEGVAITQSVQSALREGADSVTLRIRFLDERGPGYVNNTEGGALVVDATY